MISSAVRTHAIYVDLCFFSPFTHHLSHIQNMLHRSSTGFHFPYFAHGYLSRIAYNFLVSYTLSGSLTILFSTVLPTYVYRLSCAGFLRTSIAEMDGVY